MGKYKVKCKDTEGHEIIMTICPKSGICDIDSEDFSTKLSTVGIKRVLDMIDGLHLLMTTSELKSIEIEVVGEEN